MGIYLLVFFVGMFYYYIANHYALGRSSFLLAVFFLYLALFVGLGDMIGGYDRYIYGDVFDTIANETRGRQNYASLLYLMQGKEYGYFVWNILVAHITENRYIFFLLTTILMYILYYQAFVKYLDNYPIAVIVFLGLFYYFTMTYLRQVIAAGIIWQGIKYLLQRRPIPFFIIVFIAFLFHSSAAIFGLMYFIPVKKYSEKGIIKFLILCLIIGASPAASFLLKFTGENTGMGGRTEVYASEQMSGIRYDYIVEVIVFLWIILKNYHKIYSDRKSLIFFNMSLAYCGVLMIFIRFGQGGRLGWYFFMGLIYTFTSIIQRSRRTSMTTIMVMLMCFGLFVRVTYYWSSMNVPYKTFLVDGEPSGNGSIYERYEYDRVYTNDKFYRKSIDIVFFGKDK